MLRELLTDQLSLPANHGVVGDRPPVTPLQFGLLALILSGCGASQLPDTPPKTTQPHIERTNSNVDFAKLRPRIEKFCGDCHAVPDPATFPKSAWHSEVAQGYRFYDESQRIDLKPPPMSDVVAYYRNFAPEQLEWHSRQPADDTAQLTFTKRHLAAPKGMRNPAVSHISWIRHRERPFLVVCDMRLGLASRLDVSSNPAQTTELARLQHPAAMRPIQFTGDPQPGFVVGELGTFQPGDHKRGRVSWLRGRPDGSGFDAIVLKSKLGRVADVRSADFDGDQKLDLLVAEFGWRTTGRILLLRQTTAIHGVPQFQTTELDKRHGTIHVPIVDLNADGHPDFIALVSQEHEAIDAFLNKGNGQFNRKRIYQANDPSFGSSGIEVVDLDADGDLDVVYTNGDSLDSQYLKPYHAVHWLENRGRFPFTHHKITRLPGVSRAITVDLDSDGDLDIACTAHLPASIIDRQTDGKIESLMWLEQLPGPKFRPHEIQRGSSGYLALTSGDFNGD
ncbi:MAG: VCBS repeat-containing protein, partial [Planctomycetaceae bacterium]